VYLSSDCNCIEKALSRYSKMINLYLYLQNTHIYICKIVKSKDSSVDMAVGYGLDSWGLILGRDKIFICSVASRPALEPTLPPVQRYWGLFPQGVKWPGREANYSPACSAEIKNGRAIPPLPHMSSWCGA
jgi:hypothetical protein